MRVYRTYYKDKDGKKKQVKKWWIETRDHLNVIRRFPAFTDKRQSEALARQIVKLANSRVAGEQPDAELSRWLEGIPDKLRGRFVSIGLLDTKRAAAGKPLCEHVDDFVQSLLAKGVVLRHAKQVKSRITRISNGCNFRYWSDISGNKTERFIASMRKGEKAIGAQTSNDYLKVFKQFALWMIDEQRASESPIRHLKPVKVTEKRERTSLEPEEIRKLLESTQHAPKRYNLTGPERVWLYKLAIETGLRREELRSLTVSSVNFEGCTVTVEAKHSKNRKKSVLPLRKNTIEDLKVFIGGKMPQVKVFKKITNRTADMIKEDLADIGISHVDESGRHRDFHSLRHTTGSLLAASGVHPKVAQSIMRHENINLTMSVYTHTLRGQETQAIESLPELSIPSQGNQKATGTDGKNLAQNLSLNRKLPRTKTNCKKPSNCNSKTTAGFLSQKQTLQNAQIPLTV